MNTKCDWCFKCFCIGEEIALFENSQTKRISFFHEQCAKDAHEEWADEQLAEDFEFIDVDFHGDIE